MSGAPRTERRPRKAAASLALLDGLGSIELELELQNDWDGQSETISLSLIPVPANSAHPSPLWPRLKLIEPHHSRWSRSWPSSIPLNACLKIPSSSSLTPILQLTTETPDHKPLACHTLHDAVDGFGFLFADDTSVADGVLTESMLQR